MLLLKGFIETVENEGLFEMNNESGMYLYNNLLHLQDKYKDLLHNVRGDHNGTFLAFDVKGRDEFIKYLKEECGIYVGPCGTHSIRVRTSLIFDKPHAIQFIDSMSIALGHFWAEHNY